MGMARRRDILKGLEPKFLQEKPLEHRKNLWNVQVDPDLSELSVDRVMSEVRRRAELPVSEVMLPIEVTVDAHDHIVKVIYEMNKHNLSLIPVLSGDAVVGVIRSVDVFHEIAKFVI
jgi:predicted transcriptional regulator